MTVENIKHKLNETLKPELIEIIDNSADHAGHAGAQRGGGHYNVTIVASCFRDKTMVQRHQMVYQALGDLMQEDIHALGINALTPFEHIQGN